MALQLRIVWEASKSDDRLQGKNEEARLKVQTTCQMLERLTQPIQLLKAEALACQALCEQELKQDNIAEGMRSLLIQVLWLYPSPFHSRACSICLLLSSRHTLLCIGKLAMAQAGRWHT